MLRFYINVKFKFKEHKMLNSISFQKSQTKFNSKHTNVQKLAINNNLSPLKADKVSFTGTHASFDGTLEHINKNEFPDDLYLNMDEVFAKFEKQRSYHRWEKFPFMLADLLAKRTNYLGLTDEAEGSALGTGSTPSYGFPRTRTISVAELGEKEDRKLDKSYTFNWTREYNELETFFKKGIAEGGSSLFGAEDSMEQIREGLPKILKKQGWIK